MQPLPEKFVARVSSDLGDAEGRALCGALDGVPPVSVRLNPVKLGAASPGISETDRTRIITTGDSDACGELATTGSVPGCAAAAGDMGTAGVCAEPGAECAAAAGDMAADEKSGHAGVRPAEVPEAGACSESVPSESFEELLRGARPAEVPEAGACSESVSSESFEELLRGARPVPWSCGGYYLAERPSFTLDTDFHAGAYYVQEAGSQFVGHLLSGVDLAGKRVLDLCAAPGGKTTLYASLVGADGLVVANEIDRRRAQVLADNVRKWGTGNVAVTVCEPRQIAAFEGWFDVVAVDAPCSGEGMFRKDEGARTEWSEQNVNLCAARQKEILREAWRSLRAGGTLIYSTCTFNRQEDAGVLEAFVEELGAEVVQAPEVETDGAWGVVCGVVGPFQTFRFYPHRAQGEGFFAAVARKAFDTGGRAHVPKGRRAVFATVARDEVRELSHWVKNPSQMHFLRIEDTCYAYPETQVEAVRTLAEALPVICSGVEMGQVFKGKLKPAPALAFYAGLNRGALPVAELEKEEALDFLRKRDLSAELFAEGMNLVTARGRALGFVKRIGNRVNNLYPNSLRILNQ